MTITEFNSDLYYVSGSIDAKFIAKKGDGIDGFDSIFVKCKFNRLDMTVWSDRYEGSVEGPDFTFTPSQQGYGSANYYEDGDSLTISYDWEDPDMRNYHSRSFDLKLDNPGSPDHKANEKNHWVYKDNSTKTSSTSTDELKITRWDPARRKIDANFTLKGERWEIKNMTWYRHRK